MSLSDDSVKQPVELRGQVGSFFKPIGTGVLLRRKVQRGEKGLLKKALRGACQEKVTTIASIEGNF